MTFPSISTKATNIEITPKIERLIEQKIAPLGRFVGGHEGAVKCEVEIAKVAEHQSGKIYRAEVNLTIGGKLYRAEATEEQIEKAIDEVRDELKVELSKASDKRESLFKQGGRKIKEMMHKN